MNGLEFGALDEFYEEVFNFTSAELDKLNLTEVYEFAMLKCEEIFIGKCWWRNKYTESCCSNFFELQRTEYGLCYSFNGAVSDIGKEKEVRLNNFAVVIARRIMKRFSGERIGSLSIQNVELRRLERLESWNEHENWLGCEWKQRRCDNYCATSGSMAKLRFLCSGSITNRDCY